MRVRAVCVVGFGAKTMRDEEKLHGVMNEAQKEGQWKRGDKECVTRVYWDRKRTFSA